MKLSIAAALAASTLCNGFMHQAASRTAASMSVSRNQFVKVASGAAVAAAVSILAVGATAVPALAAAATSKSGYDLTPMSQQEVEEKAKAFNDLQKRVLLQAGTERSGTGMTVNGFSGATKEEGTWVSAVSGVPLFPSSTKYDSGTGWPSFYAPVDPEHIIERVDPHDQATLPKMLWRTEVLDRKSGTHLGHVFPALALLVRARMTA
eukprot:6305-Heterococcus_DN1.PRE.6